MLHRESDLQQACVTWFGLTHAALRGLLFAVPNGGWRSEATAARLKREGVVAGVADLLLLAPGADGAHALCVEMKTDKGRQSPEQMDWQRRVTARGYRYVVCRSLDDFAAAIADHLGEGH